MAQAASAAAPAPPTPCPPLREDLRLHESTPDRDGSPAWAIQDPVNNRFYRIGWFEYECLLRWPGNPARIASEITRDTPLAADAELVAAFGQFLERNHLTRPTAQGLQRLQQQLNAPGWRHWKWWLHHYLFVRVPLVRPDHLLSRMLPWVAPLFTRTALLLLLFATGMGLLMVMRQWDVFTHSVMDLISPSGLVGFLLALILSKTLHELGHALVATRYGLRVAHMGVAFVVLWPMLYTDTGESWRLRSHRQRLAISVAGIAVELAIAGLATLAWALLDDGALRQAMLYLATTAWILSLALNASPFMRFDGYFILSDILDFPNLHERAGAMARTCLRRRLLGLPDPYPEPIRQPARRALVLFAFVTWLYRLTVFLAIAWAVYTFFFKLLGIFLLVVEIAWFIVRPIWSEVTVWKERWPDVRRTRRYLLTGLGLLALGLLAMPWEFDVRAPGAAHAQRQQFVYAPLASRLDALHAPGPLAQGAVLARFSAPDLDAQRLRTQASIQALEQRLNGLMADDAGMTQRQAILNRLAEQHAELHAIDAEAQRLHVAAEFDGQWLDVAQDLPPGSWVDVRTPLGVLHDPRSWVVDAYVEQRDVERIQPGAQARFYPHGTGNSLPASVLFIDPARSTRLANAMLDGQHGGPIATQTGGHAAGMPLDTLYRVRLQLDAPPPAARETPGRAHIDGTRQSLLWEGGKWLLSVLIRESGF